MNDRALFDPGLQPERTELAWRRTALAVAVGSLLSLRVLPPTLPDSIEAWGFAPGLVGLLAAYGIWLAARRRHLRLTAVLTGSTLAEAPGSVLLVALTTLTGMFGMISLTLILIPMLI